MPKRLVRRHFREEGAAFGVSECECADQLDSTDDVISRVVDVSTRGIRGVPVLVQEEDGTELDSAIHRCRLMGGGGCAAVDERHFIVWHIFWCGEWAEIGKRK